MKRREEMQVNVAGLRRNIKNLAHNYSDAQIKVREATSNDHWGPSSTLMSEIADLTYNVVAFTEIMQMIWKRLNDHGKNWRHVYKALLLLEYLIKTGSEKVAQQCKENIYAIQTLRDFQYFEDSKDPGLNVREKAKQLVILLKDEERLRNERTRALKAKERFAQAASAFGNEVPITRETWSSNCTTADIPPKAEIECARPQTAGEEELQLQLALAMSREEAEQEEQKRRSDDVRLQLALSQSEKEFKQHNQPTSHLADLLEIDPGLGLGPQPPLVDPWGMPISAPTTMAPSIPRNDAWSITSSPSLLSPAPSPHSVMPSIAISSSDSWPSSSLSSRTAVACSRPSDDPWRTLSTRTENGPASITPSVSSMSAVSNDPWTPQAKSSVAPSTNAPQPQLDDFASAGNQYSSHQRNASGTSPTSFDLSCLENGLALSGAANNSNTNVQNATNNLRKTPQSFLGENSGLVNLDKLITTPTIPPLPTTISKSSSVNPFGGLTGLVTTNASSGTSLYSKSFTPTSTFQGDPFQPVQPKSTTLPQPIMPQPNPFLS